MVSFQCNGCGDVVKKPKLDTHYGRCHASFDCIDCMKTFNSPAEYKSHTQCISEAEKYQKGLYKGPKVRAANQTANSQSEHGQNGKKSKAMDGAKQLSGQSVDNSSNDSSTTPKADDPPTESSSKKRKKSKKRKMEDEAVTSESKNDEQPSKKVKTTGYAVDSAGAQREEHAMEKSEDKNQSEMPIDPLNAQLPPSPETSQESQQKKSKKSKKKKGGKETTPKIAGAEKDKDTIEATDGFDVVMADLVDSKQEVNGDGVADPTSVHAEMQSTETLMDKQDINMKGNHEAVGHDTGNEKRVKEDKSKKRRRKKKDDAEVWVQDAGTGEDGKERVDKEKDGRATERIAANEDAVATTATSHRAGHSGGSIGGKAEGTGVKKRSKSKKGNTGSESATGHVPMAEQDELKTTTDQQLKSGGTISATIEGGEFIPSKHKKSKKEKRAMKEALANGTPSSTLNGAELKVREHVAVSQELPTDLISSVSMKRKRKEERGTEDEAFQTVKGEEKKSKDKNKKVEDANGQAPPVNGVGDGEKKQKKKRKSLAEEIPAA